MHQMHFSVIKVKTNSVSCKYVKIELFNDIDKKELLSVYCAIFID